MSVIKKGWCPSLTRPMETGDGLLVRFHIRYGIVKAEEARIIAECARHYGNGYIDLTSRGNLQIRGVKHEEYAELFAEISAQGFVELPRPERPTHPDYVAPLGFLPTQGNNDTIGLGLAFGRLDADKLGWLADITQRYGNGAICLSPWRAVYLVAVDRSLANTIMAEAQAKGFVTDNNDPRRMIRTCPGAPACSSAQRNTHELAMAIADAMPDLVASGKTVHVSGCAKGCACPQKTSVVVTATADGYDIAWDEVAGAVAHASLTAAQILKAVA